MKISLNTIFKPKLIFNKRIFFCQIGKNGIIPQYKKKEGDKKTPIGKWKIENIFIRRDKNLKIKLNFFLRNKLIYINKNLIWCDDRNSNSYNRLIKQKKPTKDSSFSYENLYRDDDVYDILLTLNHNKNPTIKNKGSAIFIHCSFQDFRSTLGCIALKKNNLKFLINNLQTRNYIYIR
ncbi:MAG: transpeptidase [SAR116 cluster bacterium]|nr:transpeptidase [SAR116 cluster bacterium]RPH11801.1 MAG: transpeptidase [Alphaproteobacteria bacterium TMED54]|tara:strand:- start:31 stop:564 length:534 start_codon:yes stop_codon:yes gene_type:complete